MLFIVLLVVAVADADASSTIMSSQLVVQMSSYTRMEEARHFVGCVAGWHHSRAGEVETKPQQRVSDCHLKKSIAR